MPVRPLNLDDRTFADLFAEVRALIPRHAPDWTDHNVSDPGIMVLELFAWLTEAMLYRINRVSDASRVRLLELLGAVFQPAQPAVLGLRVRVGPLDAGKEYALPRNQIIWGHTATGARVPFEVVHPVRFTRADPVREVILRQTCAFSIEALPRSQAGHPFELVPVGEQYLAPPLEARPRQPVVTVDGVPWMRVDALRNLLQGYGNCFALRPTLAAVAFGGGARTGEIPPRGAQIQVTYRWEPAPRALVTDTFTGTGEPWQLYRLTRPLCLLDLCAPSEFEPRLMVQEGNGPPETWEFVTHILDMKTGAPQFSFEPWHNALRLGGEQYGRTPDASARLSLAARFTAGSAGNLPHTGAFHGWPAAPEGALPNVTVQSWTFLARGSDPTTLDEARVQVAAMLKPDWRAVTADDFRSVIQTSLPAAARVVCLPGHIPSDTEGRRRPAYVGTIIISDRTAELTAPSAQLHEIVGGAVASRRLAAQSCDGTITLWNLDSHEPMTRLMPAGVSRVTFSPNGQRILTCAPDVPAAGSTRTGTLWDARTGERLKELWDLATLDPTCFSPHGRWVVSAHPNGVQVRHASDGALARTLWGAAAWECVAFGPRDGSALAANGAEAHLWVMPEDEEPYDALAAAAGAGQELTLAGPFTAAAYSAEGTCAAASAADGRVGLWHMRLAPDGRPLVRRKTDFALRAHGPASGLLLNPAGTRLLILAADGIATLWSARTGTRLAELAAGSPVQLLALSGDDRWLATAHANRTVRIWHAVNGEPAAALDLGARAVALAFAPGLPRLVTLTDAGPDQLTLTSWNIAADPVREVAQHIVFCKSPPILHTSGQWLAYADERLVHIWDMARAADINTLYADFDDAAVRPDGWELAPVARTPARQMGICVATGSPVALTAEPYIRITSAADGQKRTVEFWDAELVYRAAKVMAARRLVTTRTEIVGPAYSEVAVSLTVRRQPTAGATRLENDIRTALARFFDPLHGGPDGGGWPLGRPVYSSEICQVVEAVAGVDHVESVTLPEPPAGATQHDLVTCSVALRVV